MLKSSQLWLNGLYQKKIFFLVYIAVINLLKNCHLCSINGENIHYGTPLNPRAPDRVPGGSSSGSAVAVGAKLVDFSLGDCFHSGILF